MSCDHARTCGDCFTAAYEAAQDQRIQELEAQCAAMWDALDRIRQFRHHEACDRRDACACWELELHVLLPILRNESAATEPKPIKETHKESVMSREPKT